jgi:hypothetical protein
LQKYKRSGALKQNGQPSAVDLRSNGHGRMRAPWTAPRARRTGPRWTVPKGYAIWTVRARSDGPGRVHAMGGGGVAGDRSGAAVPRREIAGAPYLAAQGAISRACGLYA